VQFLALNCIILANNFSFLVKTLMDRKLIKKSEKLTLRQMKEIEEAEDQLLQADNVNFSPTIVEEEPAITPVPQEPNYIPSRDNPVVQSVCNSGWQVSDIWRDIRVDDFCGG
jgi:hypothetical protein